MPAIPHPMMRRTLRAIFGLITFAYVGLAAAQDVPIVLPGAPGEDVRDLSAEEAIEIAGNSYSPDDVQFMQDMIPHHNQAVQMSELVGDRTNNQELRDVAGRIDASQVDEIDFMEGWLRDRGEDVPEATAHSAMHTSHDMAGMASPADMAELAQLEGTEFDRKFLTLMIAHHEGAVTMVEELLEQPGSAYDPVLFQFVNDVTNDQSQEIERMNGMLASLSADARAGLSAGFLDAGQAIMNMELLAFLPKPPGFFDPENPMGLPPAKPTLILLKMRKMMRITRTTKARSGANVRRF